VVAGLVAGLLVRNNQLAGGAAAVMASAASAIILVPRSPAAGAAARRASRRGVARAIARRTELERIAALGAVVTAAYVAAGAIAAAGDPRDRRTRCDPARDRDLGRVRRARDPQHRVGGSFRRGAGDPRRRGSGARRGARRDWLAWLGVPGAGPLAACAVLALGTVKP